MLLPQVQLQLRRGGSAIQSSVWRGSCRKVTCQQRLGHGDRCTQERKLTGLTGCSRLLCQFICATLHRSSTCCLLVARCPSVHPSILPTRALCSRPRMLALALQSGSLLLIGRTRSRGRRRRKPPQQQRSSRVARGRRVGCLQGRGEGRETTYAAEVINPSTCHRRGPRGELSLAPERQSCGPSGSTGKHNPQRRWASNKKNLRNLYGNVGAPCLLFL